MIPEEAVEAAAERIEVLLANPDDDAGPTIEYARTLARAALRGTEVWFERQVEGCKRRPTSDQLRALRRARKLSQEQVARLAGCSVARLRQIEAGFDPHRASAARDRITHVLTAPEKCA